MSPWPWTGWYVEPEIPIGLVAVSLAYAAGLGPLRPLEARGEPVATRALLRFGLGMLTLFLALTGPLADLAGTFLISAHMVQHLLLTLIAPPLLLAAMPDWLLRPLLRPPAVAVVARAVTRPRTALAVFDLQVAGFGMRFQRFRERALRALADAAPGRAELDDGVGDVGNKIAAAGRRRSRSAPGASAHRA